MSKQERYEEVIRRHAADTALSNALFDLASDLEAAGFPRKSTAVMRIADNLMQTLNAKQRLG